jgi:5S rRNA maturation endonuclease (ribonuclease M5)
MEINKNFKRMKVRDITIFDITSISQELYDNEVYVFKKRKLTPFSQELVNILTERFIREQLGLINQEIDYRTIWYEIVDYRLKGKDLGISLKNPYIAFEKAVKEYCIKLMTYYKVSHFSFVMDNLNITAKGKAIIYDLNLEGKLLDVKTLKNFEYIPFFFLICEKEVILKQTLKSIKDLGYKGFYGINTGGVGTSAVARLLLKYQESIPNKFYVFVLVDYDLAGMKIFFNLKKYFKNSERIGISLEMLKYLNIEHSDLISHYTSTKSLNKQKKDCMTMLDDLELSFLEKIYYLQEIDNCSKNKIELNALSGYTSEINRDINPCIHFANYFQYIIEKNNRYYDLNRYRQIDEVLTYTLNCNIDIPEFILNIKSEINDLLFNDIDDIDYWIDIVKETYDNFREFNQNNESKKDSILRNKKRIMTKENNDYFGKIRNIDDYIDNQQNKLNKVKEIKDKLIRKNIKFQDVILKKEIENSNIFQEHKDDLESILEKIKEVLS